MRCSRNSAADVRGIAGEGRHRPPFHARRRVGNAYLTRHGAEDRSRAHVDSPARRGDHAGAMARDIQARYAICLVEDEDHALLFLKRAAGATLGAGLWGFPAGHIEAGEGAEDCARRELREEIGGGCRLELVNRIGPVRDTYYGGVFEIYLFHYRWQGGVVRLNDEHSAYAWVSREDYRAYPVMDGIDEDIAYFGIWPRAYLNADRLPR